ncbi:uncharacterized protein LOC141678517 isoform X2 [Apium graveolens]|uniref:uncharacterized protein LOC141678517 isoform X2 n=1 Tax=Apium graveolens TaxID=4045 RepID=UPI003D798DC9
MDQSSSRKRDNTCEDIPDRVKFDSSASYVDILPSKRGRPRKDSSSANAQVTHVNSENHPVKKRERPRKQNVVSSPVNQGRFKSTKFFTDHQSKGRKKFQGSCSPSTQNRRPMIDITKPSVGGKENNNPVSSLKLQYPFPTSESRRPITNQSCRTMFQGSCSPTKESKLANSDITKQSGLTMFQDSCSPSRVSRRTK